LVKFTQVAEVHMQVAAHRVGTLVCYLCSTQTGMVIAIK